MWEKEKMLAFLFPQFYPSQTNAYQHYCFSHNVFNSFLCLVIQTMDCRLSFYHNPDFCEFDTRSRRTLFMAFLHLSPLQKHVGKIVNGCGLNQEPAVLKSLHYQLSCHGLAKTVNPFPKVQSVQIDIYQYLSQLHELFTK